ncbi:hypothetical protein ACFZBU_47885 [Embleya sp. NPDC008237]|uniref:hypothetical protein n=1 Tax=Embleya sp. NPDC008237 TaxID=3363978 RepID=UPI0036ED84DB
MARFGQDEESARSLDLPSVVETYTRKAADLRRRCGALAHELASTQAELELVEARRVVLAEVLDEVNTKLVEDHSASGVASAEFVVGEVPVGEPSDRTVESPERRVAATTALGGTRAGHGKLGDAIVRVLATSGRSMRVREVTESLGRETTRPNLETTRVTIKRLVKSATLVELQKGLYRIASTEASEERGVA